MWTTKEFANVLERHPDGGTLWTRTHRTVRYIRVLRPDSKTVVAIMTEIAGSLKGNVRHTVQLFVKNELSTQIAEFPNPTESAGFLESLVSTPVLETVPATMRPQITAFLSSPNRTILTTW